MKYNLDLFPARLKEARKKKNISQSKLANITHLQQHNIACYETGANKPGSVCLVALAEALDVRVDYLLGYES